MPVRDRAQGGAARKYGDRLVLDAMTRLMATRLADESVLWSNRPAHQDV
jgi:hypothetical protein